MPSEQKQEKSETAGNTQWKPTPKLVSQKKKGHQTNTLSFGDNTIAKSLFKPSLDQEIVQNDKPIDFNYFEDNN